MANPELYSALKSADSTRGQILNAAMICIMTVGPARTNISSIATQAGVSRPTVYAHFETLEELTQEAISKGTELLVNALTLHAGQFATSRERVFEAFARLLTLSDQVDVLRKPMSFERTAIDPDQLPAEAISAARKLLDKLLDDRLEDERAANEQAETGVRFFLSLAAYRRDDARGYIDRIVLPAMRLG